MSGKVLLSLNCSLYITNDWGYAFIMRLTVMFVFCGDEILDS